MVFPQTHHYYWLIDMNTTYTASLWFILSCSEDWLRRKLYDQTDDLNILIVNFPFICNNISSPPVHGVYISLLLRYPSGCGSCQDFLNRGLLLTRKLMNQGLLLANLKSSLRKLYDHHHMLSWQLRNICVTSDHGYVPLVVRTSRSFPHSSHITGFVTRAMRRVPLVEQELPALPRHMAHPGCSGARVSRSVVFCVVFCRSLFVRFLLAIVLSVLKFMYFDYPFGIFKLFWLLIHVQQAVFQLYAGREQAQHCIKLYRNEGRDCPQGQRPLTVTENVWRIG